MLRTLSLLLLLIAENFGQLVPVTFCRNSGFFRHPVDCTKFYRCVETLNVLDPVGGSDRFSVFNFDCPAGTVFDELIQV